tara:strand:+ start:31 stop:300 length:270 start_codon:yes stop_codon:yes gene_type:complete
MGFDKTVDFHSSSTYNGYMKERCLMKELDLTVGELLKRQLRRIVEDWVNVAFEGNAENADIWITQELNIIFEEIGDLEDIREQHYQGGV